MVILRGFAEAGESVNSTAQILKIPGPTFSAWAKKYAAHLPWPAVADTNGWRNANRTSAAHKRAAIENLKKAWEARRRVP